MLQPTPTRFLQRLKWHWSEFNLRGEKANFVFICNHDLPYMDASNSPSTDKPTQDDVFSNRHSISFKWPIC